jgi:hypothetical protein
MMNCKLPNEMHKQTPGPRQDLNIGQSEENMK